MYTYDPNAHEDFSADFGMSPDRNPDYELERVHSSFSDLVAQYVEKRKSDGHYDDQTAILGTIHDKIVKHMQDKQKKLKKGEKFTFDQAFNELYARIFGEYSSYKPQRR